MTAKARCCLWLALLLIFASCRWRHAGGNIPTAEKIRADAVAQAKKDGKLVLLVFAAHDKSWSDRLDAYHADADVSSVLGKHFVITRIDVEETPAGLEMYLEHAPRNAPAFSILDSRGMILSDSGEGSQNVGFPNNAEQVDQYIAALRAGCPQLSEEDEAVLRAKLEQMRVAPPE